MPDLYQYSNDFDPLFLPGRTVTLYGTGLDVNGLAVRCSAVGALPEYVHDFGALTATVWSTDEQITNLDMNPLELAQLRMRLVDDVKVQFKNSAAVQQWRTKATPFYMPRITADEPEWLSRWLWKSSEFFIWEDNRPSWDVYSQVALSACYVLFSGWRYKFEKLSAGTPTTFTLWVSDWAAKTMGG